MTSTRTSAAPTSAVRSPRSRRVALAAAGAMVLGGALAAPWAGSAASATTAPNLIKRGGFDSPTCAQQFCVVFAGQSTLAPWSVTGSSVELDPATTWKPKAGTQSLDLAGVGPGGISQTVATTPGAQYVLQYSYAGHPTCGQKVKSFTVLWNGSVVTTQDFDTTPHTLGAMGWTTASFVLTATGTSSTVGFADVTADQSQCGATLDSVSLRAF